MKMVDRYLLNWERLLCSRKKQIWVFILEFHLSLTVIPGNIHFHSLFFNLVDKWELCDRAILVDLAKEPSQVQIPHC